MKRGAALAALTALSFEAADLPPPRASRKARPVVDGEAQAEAAGGVGVVGVGLPSSSARVEADAAEADAPFVARGSRFRERLAACCRECFQASASCVHHAERPLQLLLVGMNPSRASWEQGFAYANPSNMLWQLLTGGPLGVNQGSAAFAGVLPAGLALAAQNELPATHGVGFTDLGLVPESDAAAFSDAETRAFVPDLLRRLRAHVRRAGRAPRLVAFTGVKQFRAVFAGQLPAKGAVPLGEWLGELPPGWPFGAATRVWVLPSSSGRAVLSHEQRARPYRELAQAFHALAPSKTDCLTDC